LKSEHLNELFEVGLRCDPPAQNQALCCLRSASSCPDISILAKVTFLPLSIAVVSSHTALTTRQSMSMVYVVAVVVKALPTATRQQQFTSLINPS
jgi:hypothetical protein